MSKLWFFLNLFALAFTYFQNDYYIKYESHTIPFYNKDYFSDGNHSYHFFNRTTRVFSYYFNLKKNIGLDLKFTFQVYKFASNEYRYFPVYYEENPCITMALDNFGVSMSHFDTNIKSCPLEKGFYYLKNAKADQSHLPPHVPRGRFMFDARVYEKDVLLVQGKICIKVVPTNPLEIEHF